MAPRRGGSLAFLGSSLHFFPSKEWYEFRWLNHLRGLQHSQEIERVPKMWYPYRTSVSKHHGFASRQDRQASFEIPKTLREISQGSS